MVRGDREGPCRGVGDADGARHPGRGRELWLRHPQTHQRALRRRADWTEGLLYPLLHRLERLGHVEATWQSVTGERRRKYYRVTEQGLAELAEQRRQWDTVVDALKESGSALTPSIPPEGPRMTASDSRKASRRRSASGGNTCNAAASCSRRRRRAGGPPARLGRRAHRGRAARGRGVPRRGQAHGQPRRAVPRVRPGALGAAVEAARPHRRRPAAPGGRRPLAARPCG